MKNVLIKIKWMFLLFIAAANILYGQHSVARQWNELLLEAIRHDFARPTIHAHNLFHVSIAMYDAWAVYDDVASTYLLGKTVDGFDCPFDGIEKPANVKQAREEAISFASYRLLTHRFFHSPGDSISLPSFDSLMVKLGYDTSEHSVDYFSGSAAALGNYIAQKLIEFGLQDGSNEDFGYGNLYYLPVNEPLDPTKYGDSTLTDPNRWQPLTLGTFIDQSGHQIPIKTPEFLGAEWGEVSAFALNEQDLNIYNRDGYDYWVFHDPGAPPQIDTSLVDTVEGINTMSEEYMWTFSLVAIWSSHLDARDSVMWDVSPASIGNVQQLPTTLEGMRNFYNLEEGGDPGIGHALNPVTGMPYQPQIVPRGDYTRILAEFWADGPNSETPPGHWFTILNYVNDHPLFEKKFKGTGPVLDDLEWDVKAYFVLSGAVHDAAVASWGIKGWYDYIRPISAIRSMADRGQSSDTSLANYHPAGIPLKPGLIEVVTEGDSLAGEENENVGKIKLKAWKGHYYIDDPETEDAGVGWILAGEWWPYQRPSFVTPPFAGYVSGHSTFSRAAAEVMTLLTGDAYFPGGMGEFYCPKNEFLVFEDGPSMDVTLQWATYRDASDQCSLSRIWGGIHPPVDDIPGRLIGREVGIEAFNFAEFYFNGQITTMANHDILRNGYSLTQNYPNPFNPSTKINFSINKPGRTRLVIYDELGSVVKELIDKRLSAGSYEIEFDASQFASGFYYYRLTSGSFKQTRKMLFLK